jgi:hypothetical protein
VPAASLLPQLVSASMKGGLTMISLILIVFFPLTLTIDIVCGALVVPTATSPKSSPNLMFLLA